MTHRSLADELLCSALIAGSLLVMLVPAARESVAIGWLPMWLVGMPAIAWWALHGFAMPELARERGGRRVARVARVQAQARRRAPRRVEARRAAA